MKWIFLLIFTIPIFPHQFIAQTRSPYSWNAGADAAIFAVGSVSTGLGIYFGNRTKKLTLQDVQSIDNQKIVLKIDRRATQNWSAKNDHASDVILSIGMASPVVLLAFPEIRKSNLALLGTMALEAYLLTEGLTSLVKNSVRRTRPYVYNDAVPNDEKFSKFSRQSFFSGHTSKSAAVCFFSAQLFSDFYPDSKFKPWVWAGAATLPAIVGLNRYLAGKHFPTDVLIGYLVGGTCGWLVPKLHKKKEIKVESGFMPAISIGSASVLAMTLTF